MSADTREWAWEQDLPSRDKFVLVCLASYANGGHRAWPRQSQVAKYTGLANKTVERSIKALKRAGLISAEKRFRDDGSRMSDVLILQTETQAQPNELPSQSPGGTVTESGGHRHEVREAPSHSRGGGVTVTDHDPPNDPTSDPPNENHKDSAESSSGYPDWFEQLWATVREQYQRVGANPGNKSKALNESRRRMPEGGSSEAAEILTEQIERKLAIRAANQFTPQPPHFERWMKYRHWENELEPLPANERPYPNAPGYGLVV